MRDELSDLLSDIDTILNDNNPEHKKLPEPDKSPDRLNKIKKHISLDFLRNGPKKEKDRAQKIIDTIKSIAYSTGVDTNDAHAKIIDLFIKEIIANEQYSKYFRKRKRTIKTINGVKEIVKEEYI